VAHRKWFSPEFRQEAVRLYRVSGRPYRAVAEELAVAAESLQRWVLQAVLDEARRPHAEPGNVPSRNPRCEAPRSWSERRSLTAGSLGAGASVV